VIDSQSVRVVAMAPWVNNETWIAALDRHRHGPGGPFRWRSSYERGRAGVELWVAMREDRLREDVARIQAWREKVRGNRLAKTDLDPPFGQMEWALLRSLEGLEIRSANSLALCGSRNSNVSFED